MAHAMMCWMGWSLFRIKAASTLSYDFRHDFEGAHPGLGKQGSSGSVEDESPSLKSSLELCETSPSETRPKKLMIFCKSQ